MARTQNAAGGSGGVAAALVHIALGQHDAALDSIEQAVRARRLTAFSLRGPRLDPIASRRASNRF